MDELYRPGSDGRPLAARYNARMDSPERLLVELVEAPGPPGAEGPVREVLTRHLESAGIAWKVDARGNLLASPGTVWPDRPSVVVTAHLDEIALMVRRIEPDGSLGVAPLGGAHPWKWGEAPVDVLIDPSPLAGILSFGSIHTTHPESVVQKARDGKVPVWEDARVFTGYSRSQLPASVRPGTRIVLSRPRRAVVRVGVDDAYLAAPFLDDRIDCAAWLLALLRLRDTPGADNVLFAATTSEELGGHGALWLLGGLRPEVCLALEIAPVAPDNDLVPDAVPTCWAADGYSPTSPQDLDLVAAAAREAGTGVEFHVLSRGGSDSSCAAAAGHCARPITLAVSVANSHGLEIVHRDALDALVRLACATIGRLSR